MNEYVGFDHRLGFTSWNKLKDQCSVLEQAERSVQLKHTRLDHDSRFVLLIIPQITSIHSNYNSESKISQGIINLEYYPTITYYWTVSLKLDHSYLVGNLTNSKIAETKALELLKS